MDGQLATILVTELVGVGALFSADRDGAADSVRREHLEALRQALGEHGGREVSAGGDGLMATFTSSVAAVRCAVEMQRACASAGRLELSAGLEAGEPIADGDELYGTPVIVARGLCQAARGGEVLASEIVVKIASPHLSLPIEPAERVRLSGRSERVTAARVRWLEDEADGPAPAPTPSPVRVVIADDQRLLRAGFRVILDAEPDISVVGEASDGRGAVDVVSRTRPDVALMDIRMPELDGLQAAERILSDAASSTAVIMLTTFDLREYVYEALRVGASGFLLKDTPAERLLDAVRVVAAGDALLAPSITRRLIEQFTRAARPEPGEVPARLAELSARELEVLGLVARGLSNAEVAAELVLGESTVKTHVAHVLGKLGLRDRVQAVVVAYETGLVAPELSPHQPGGAAARAGR